MAFCTIGLLGCAKQGYPPGGPEDKIGPHVIASHPEPGSVEVNADVRPWILLDEYPDQNSIESYIFVSPELEGGFKARVRGKRIEVRFTKQLPPDRTIVVTFGSGIRDRRGNQMDASFVLAFSTGERIDRAAIRGHLEGAQNIGAVWVWAYPLSTFSEPDPREEIAPFATQPDLEGEYKLSFMPAGEYRLFAVEEAHRNRLWDSDQEAIALPPGDVLAAADHPPAVNLRLQLRDLKAPSLRSAAALHRQALRCSFDEPVDITGIQVTAITAAGQELAIIDAYQNPADSGAVIFTTAPQRPGDVYQLRLDGVLDRAGNRADSLIATLPAASAADTLGPRLSWSSPAAGESGVLPAAEIRVGFSEAVILTDLPRAVRLLDSAGREVEGTWSFPGSALGIFQPETALQSGARYTLTVTGADSGGVRDIFSNWAPDSLVSIDFTVLDDRELGIISGRVHNATANLRVVAERQGAEGGNWEAAASTSGEYEIRNLPAGLYRLWLYQDRDENGHFSAGQFHPLVFAEPFELGPDSVRVRSRWETEGVELFWKVD